MGREGTVKKAEGGEDQKGAWLLQKFTPESFLESSASCAGEPYPSQGQGRDCLKVVLPELTYPRFRDFLADNL